MSIDQAMKPQLNNQSNLHIFYCYGDVVRTVHNVKSSSRTAFCFVKSIKMKECYFWVFCTEVLTQVHFSPFQMEREAKSQKLSAYVTLPEKYISSQYFIG